MLMCTAAMQDINVPWNVDVHCSSAGYNPWNVDVHCSSSEYNCHLKCWCTVQQCRIQLSICYQRLYVWVKSKIFDLNGNWHLLSIEIEFFLFFKIRLPYFGPWFSFPFYFVYLCARFVLPNLKISCNHVLSLALYITRIPKFST